MQQDNKRHVPDWLLERLALGELDAETAADVRRRLAAEGRTPDEIAALVAASNREILEQLPATPTAAAIKRRAERAAAAARPARKRAFLWARRSRSPVWRRGAGGASVAAAVRLPRPRRRMHQRQGRRHPPAPRLYLYRHGATRDERCATAPARRAATWSSSRTAATAAATACCCRSTARAR
jgi:anti-sigma-K factor RskA